MSVKSIIVVVGSDDVETWGSLKRLCRSHREYSYSYLKGKRFPFTYKGLRFFKVNYNQVLL